MRPLVAMGLKIIPIKWESLEIIHGDPCARWRLNDGKNMPNTEAKNINRQTDRQKERKTGKQTNRNRLANTYVF